MLLPFWDSRLQRGIKSRHHATEQLGNHEAVPLLGCVSDEPAAPPAGARPRVTRAGGSLAS